MSSYYNLRSGEDSSEERLQLISRFDSIPIIANDALAEAWPREFGVMYSANTENVPAVIPEAPVTSFRSTEGIPTLADLVIEPAVVRSLELGNTDDIELLIPSKYIQIKKGLCARNPFPDNGLALLVAVLQQEQRDSKDVETLDLSGFSLSPEQLVHIAFQFEIARIIILSHSSEVKVDHVRALLTAKLELDRLELLDTSVTNKEFSSLLDDHPELFKCISDILHPKSSSKLSFQSPAQHPKEVKVSSLLFPPHTRSL